MYPSVELGSKFKVQVLILSGADGGEFEDPNINKQAVSNDVLEEMNEEIASKENLVLPFT